MCVSSLFSCLHFTCSLSLSLSLSSCLHVVGEWANFVRASCELSWMTLLSLSLSLSLSPIVEANNWLFHWRKKGTRWMSGMHFQSNIHLTQFCIGTTHLSIFSVTVTLHKYIKTCHRTFLLFSLFPSPSCPFTDKTSVIHSFLFPLASRATRL